MSLVAIKVLQRFSHPAKKVVEFSGNDKGPFQYAKCQALRPSSKKNRNIAPGVSSNFEVSKQRIKIKVDQVNNRPGMACSKLWNPNLQTSKFVQGGESP